MKLVIGLGNPGQKYVHTRHNAGFMAVDALQKLSLPKNVLVKKTGVFMNNSGSYVKSWLAKLKISPENLYLIHDDLDIRLGEYKIQFAKSPKDHKGVSSVMESLNSEDFWHLRIGVDNRAPDSRIDGETYVLQNFLPSELGILNQSIAKAAAELISKIKS
jgi:PTH1 family peptidyl-tRNA hydrolase